MSNTLLAAILPCATASFAFGSAIAHTAVVSTLLDPSISEANITSFFSIYFRKTVGPIIAIFSASGILGGYAYHLTGHKGFLIGSVCAFAHFAFVPAVGVGIKKMVFDKTEQRRGAREWLLVHHVRTAVDGLAAAAFVWGLVEAVALK
ncbi:hypothetical protein BDR26DRAFT_861902 [Obelidium mucronatum]|nr:hypothetical protein BDR26DRAFT_861902 [Obelidium mucronatum]